MNMKILSGIDIVSNLKIKKMMKRTPNSLKDIFSGKEIEYCTGKRYPEQSFAARFAAKEAILKAIGSSITKFDLNEIEIVVSVSGKPAVRINCDALKNEIARRIGSKDFTINVSLAHEKDISIAQAIIYA